GGVPLAVGQVVGQVEPHGAVHGVAVVTPRGGKGVHHRQPPPGLGGQVQPARVGCQVGVLVLETAQVAAGQVKALGGAVDQDAVGATGAAGQRVAYGVARQLTAQEGEQVAVVDSPIGGAGVQKGPHQRHHGRDPGEGVATHPVVGALGTAGEVGAVSGLDEGGQRNGDLTQDGDRGRSGGYGHDKHTPWHSSA